ncbi:MAG TPA: hypothetical protein DCM87_10130 [Planctomycetes bacterium]|nr:hypothetical protein [Planctomycetota bacterium]
MHTLLLYALLAAEIPQAALTVRGTWVLDRKGEPVRPALWMRGLQTSGLAVSGGALVAIGDQRSNFPARLFTIALPPRGAEPPRETRLTEDPVEILPGPGLPEALRRRYESKPNPDFEDIAADPARPGVFFAVVEQDAMLLLEITRRDARGPAAITAIAEILAPDYAPWRADLNYRMEGLAVAGPGPEIIVAFERAEDSLPRLYKVVWKPGETSLPAVPLAVPFDTLTPREGKGLLNINALAYLKHGGAETLLLLARDHERLLVLDLATRAFTRIVDLDFRGPDMEKLVWTSPEGLAVDAEAGIAYMISDPDSERGNYRAGGAADAAGNYADLVPLLFAVPLDAILPGAGPPPGK